MTERLNIPGPEFAACTIIAKNYLPLARALAESWSTFHRGCPLYVLLLDSPRGFFSPESEPFHSVLVSELEIPNLNGFLFKYSILESSTAVKPYFLRYLFGLYSIDKLLYLDPDILILDSLDGLKHSLDDATVLLTPHLLSPLPNDDRRQTDHDILKSGAYNLGFLGLRNNIISQQLLRWWSDKLYHHCMVAIDNNLFVDQRWMDLAPGMFDGVRIIRDPGYNVAYWNLHERSVSVADGVSVNGKPLYFFHFSGFDPDRPWIVSKHQNRFEMADIGDARKLYQKYRDLLIEKGWNQASRWKYDHDFFRNGVQIPPSARRYYWSLGTDVVHLGDPFSWLDGDSKELAPERFDFRKAADLPFGVNVLGHFQSEKGVGEGARSNLRIVRAADFPYAANDWHDPESQNSEALPEEIAKQNPFVVNLLTVNADQFVWFASEHRPYMKDRLNIGYWAWELPEFPEEWATSFGYADEIWTPSKFTQEAVASRSPVPVKVVPHSIDPSINIKPVERLRFGIAPETFVFLFFFDFHSYLQRKNPLGLIHAYKNAFGQREDVQLIIKSSHGPEHREDWALLEEASRGANVRVVDGVLARDEAQEMMMAADCYVSLHRSEGFGLTLAEAMFCQKPVIATAYSGNVDFMSNENSFLVPYKLVTIDKTQGPYKAGCHWAKPDLDHASDLMRHIELHREAAAETGLKASAKIRELLHPATIAASVRRRLEELGLLQQAMPAVKHSENT